MDHLAQDGLPPSTLTHRSTLEGMWRSPAGRGRFTFSAGARDDHLELLAEDRCLAPPESDVVSTGGAEVWLMPFGDGRGLSVLRPLPPGHLLARAGPEQRLEDLVELLVPTLGSLRVFPGATSLEPDPPSESAPPCSLGEAASFGEAPAAPTADGRMHLLEAIAALESGRFGRAEEALRRARQDGSEDAAELLEAMKAIRRCDKAVRRRPRDPEARAALAWAYLHAEAGEAALREAAEAARLKPDLAAAHVLIAFERYYRGEPEVAEEARRRAYALLPRDHEWRRGLDQVRDEFLGSVPRPETAAPEGGGDRRPALLARLAARLGLSRQGPAG